MLLKKVKFRVDDNGRDKVQGVRVWVRLQGTVGGQHAQTESPLHTVLTTTLTHPSQILRQKHLMAHKDGTVRPFARVPFTPHLIYHPRFSNESVIKLACYESRFTFQ